MLTVGVALNLLGYVIRENEWGPYGWAMLIGTVIFGLGFLSAFYSFVRKVEYKGLVEERAEEAEKKALRKAEAARHRKPSRRLVRT